MSVFSSVLNVVSVVAACVSGVAAFMSVWLQRNDRLRDQASKITAEIRRFNDDGTEDVTSLWSFDEIETTIKSQLETAENHGQFVDLVTFRNTSSQPIYQVFLFTVSNRTLDDKDENIQIDTHRLRWFEVVSCGDFFFLIQSDGNAMGGEHALPALIFTDANGNTWYRGITGKLRKLSQKRVNQILQRNNVYGPYYQWDGFTDPCIDYQTITQQ